MPEGGTGTRSSKSTKVDRSSETMRLKEQKSGGPKSNPKSEPLSEGMVFGDGKHRAKAFEQFTLLAGEDNDVIPVTELNAKLKKQRSTLEMTDAQIEEFIKKADKNGDAMIDFREFESLMASPLGKGTRLQNVMRTLADGVIAKNQKLEVHSYLDAYNCFPPPIFILCSSIFQILIFFGYFWSEEKSHDIMTRCSGCFIPDPERPGRNMVGPLMFVPSRRGEVWRFWTYQFLHAGISHLIGNIIMQCLIGIPLEIVHKVWRIGPLYTVAVICGALLQYSLDPQTSLVGASGGVYALITAHLANVFLNWSEMPFRWVRLGVVGFYLCFDIGSVVYRRNFANECDSVSHAAHLAGGITGFCFGIFILHNMVKHKWEQIVRTICVIGWIIFFIALVIMAAVQAPTEYKWLADCTKSNQ